MKRLLLPLLCALGARGETFQADVPIRVLFTKETRYQTLLVVEDPSRRERHLCGPGCGYVHGTVSLDRPDALVPEYMRTALVGLAFLAAPPRRVLFLGMGAGLLPRFLAARYPAAATDVVEIDPEVPPVARRWFGFRDGPGTRVHVADAADFVRSGRTKWDLVVLDALFGPEVPDHLSRDPFLRDLRRRIAPGGALVANLAPPSFAPGTPALLSRLVSSGLSVTVFPTAKGTNWIAVATEEPVPPAELRIRAGRVEKELEADTPLLEILTRPGNFHPAEGSTLP